MGENGYLILTACFCLLFLAVGILWELKKKPIHLFLRGRRPHPIIAPEAIQSRVTKKKLAFLARFYRNLTWDTVCKGLGLAGGILFTRKLVYYLPYTGIIQTKFSIWWMDGGTLIFLHIIFVLYMVLIASMFESAAKVLGKFKFKIVYNPAFPLLLLLLLFLGLYTIVSLINETSISWGKVLILTIYAPLILFKMLCSGKYLGILTGLISGHFIVARYKKLSPRVTKHNAKFLIAPVVIIIVSMASGYFLFTGNWQKRFQGKLQSVKNPDAAADLLDAAYTIPDAIDKSIALKKVAAVFTAMEDTQWRKEKLRQGIKLAGTIKDSKQRYHVLEEFAVFIAAAGDTGWATSIANGITDQEIKNKVLKQIQENKGEK